jgi:hypothetical protein
MITARTLTQLQGRALTPERARDLGHMGYIQWLGGLPGAANYEAEAVRAYLMAADFIRTDPAIAVFCELLARSIADPLLPLDLRLPSPRRRGGARERRLSI